ncbi:replication factor C subunit 5-like [Tetranychus urticae]|uniref:Activator 1 subunit 5 n=1 Tax=Tetranychus urticae TaxID=32264 RepID=T1L3D7_TETUR|nr:replication factor C subunit 5-like [Tetranychus urticae]XP_015793302.1 replication factor C subunit 5-like [Tetranychus urticae]
MVVEENLPWVEKYRPNTLEELISHGDIVSTIQKFISERRIPHLLFYGPPGTGKTTTILAIAKQLYSQKEFSSMVLELNASDDRGIGIIRGPVLSFASTKAIFKTGFKLVILDEADAMTQDAQDALRRIMEKYTENTRFCLICNYLSKIKPAIQSRCTRFRFGPLSSNQIVPRLDYIVSKENVNITEDGKKAILELSGGDMRKVINLLQSTHLGFDVVDELNVYLCCGQPLKADIESVLECLLTMPFKDSQRRLITIQKEKGIALQDILSQIHLAVHKIDVSLKNKIEILRKMANIEYYISSGANETLQLSALVAAFKPARKTCT